jgi:NADPH:quinone reductase-like Zn-dependent oxidoreductase
LIKNISILGSTLRNKSFEEKVVLTQIVKKELMPQFEKGLLRAVVDLVIPIEHVEEAHRRMLENKNFGKIVLKVS